MSPTRMLALLLVTAAAAATGASAAVVPSGLHGVVMRGPISPVCRDNVPCDAPAPRVSLTFVRAGVSRTTRSDANGRYRIVLPAGIWAMRWTTSTDMTTRQLGRMTPTKVRVRAGRSDRIDFMIDTGIR
jgi:hypothetical protein